MSPFNSNHVEISRRVVTLHLNRARDDVRSLDRAALACVDAAAWEVIFAVVPREREVEAKMSVLEILGSASISLYPVVRQRANELVRECLGVIAQLARRTVAGDVVRDEDIARALKEPAAGLRECTSGEV